MHFSLMIAVKPGETLDGVTTPCSEDYYHAWEEKYKEFADEDGYISSNDVEAAGGEPEPYTGFDYFRPYSPTAVCTLGFHLKNGSYAFEAKIEDIDFRPNEIRHDQALVDYKSWKASSGSRLGYLHPNEMELFDSAEDYALHHSYLYSYAFGCSDFWEDQEECYNNPKRLKEWYSGFVKRFLTGLPEGTMLYIRDAHV